MHISRQTPLVIVLLLVTTLYPALTSARVSGSDEGATIDVPYSIVQAWQSNSRIAFPKSAEGLTTQQILMIQYYLQSRGYDVPATGRFAERTREALQMHQGDSKDLLTKETASNINKFLSFLYCPVGQNNQDTLDYRLYNVNSKRVLPSEYTPNNLVLEEKDIMKSSGPICLESETYEALKRMYEAAQEDGIDLYITSSYRSEDSQDYLLQVMIRRMGNSAYRIVALPGRSEHNLGTSLDFAGYEGGKRVPLTASKQIKWLEDNAAEFGFVNSYPAGKEYITGFNPEPWHYRYVGEPIASTVAMENITLAEFFDEYKETISREVASYGENARLLLKEVIIGG